MGGGVLLYSICVGVSMVIFFMLGKWVNVEKIGFG